MIDDIPLVRCRYHQWAKNENMKLTCSVSPRGVSWELPKLLARMYHLIYHLTPHISAGAFEQKALFLSHPF